MVAKAAPWAPLRVRVALAVGEIGLFVAVCLVLLVSIPTMGVWILALIPIFAVILTALPRYQTRRSDVWLWAEASHSELPYWYALRLRGTAYEDFAVACVELCSRASMEQDTQARVEWLHRLHRIYSIYAHPTDAGRERTLAEMQQFLSYYDD